MVDGRYFEIKK